MDRPRRDDRATGLPDDDPETVTITVVDLLRKQRQPVRIPSADEVDTDRFVGDLLGPAEPGEPEPKRGWASRAAKLIGLATGSLVLCGSVVAASTLAHERKGTGQLNPPPAKITGGDVVRPDTILAQLSETPRTGTAKPAAPPPSSSAARTTTRTAAARTFVNPPDAAAGLRPDQVVREFYALARQQPDQAAALLDPAMLADPLGFAASWTGVRQVRLSGLSTSPDGTVRAVVELLQPDGSWLRMVELLHVSEGDDPVINGAELLSAQHD